MKRIFAVVLTMGLTAALYAAEPPSPAQMDYMRRGIVAIVHWGPNTYIDKEWGFGDTSPDVVAPTRLDPAQWVRAMKAGGIRTVILVAKHHDGFCLWPSELNRDYSTAALKGKLKNRNIVDDVARACRYEKMGFGLYLSPWDRHRADYARESYVDYYHAQWEDLLTHYGDVCEIWLDGANGGDGWYGGVNGAKGERRSIPAHYYRKPKLLERLMELHPNAVAFGGNGPNSVLWCGNERGTSPDNWMYDRAGEDGVKRFTPPEADTPLRKGWFFHPNEKPKRLSEMVKTYFETVGRGAVLNWGIAPDREGRVCAADEQRLAEFGAWLKNFEARDYAKGASVSRGYKDREATYEVRLAGTEAFDAVDFAEDMSNGQLVTRWRVEADVPNASEKTRVLARGTTLGWRRIVRFGEVKAVRVRVIAQGVERPSIANLALRRVPTVED